MSNGVMGGGWNAVMGGGWNAEIALKAFWLISYGNYSVKVEGVRNVVLIRMGYW